MVKQFYNWNEFLFINNNNHISNKAGRKIGFAKSVFGRIGAKSYETFQLAGAYRLMRARYIYAFFMIID